MVNIGDYVGNYRIIDEINTSSGTFGSIYKAQHLIFTDEPVVALKILRAYLDSPQKDEQCLQEARLQKKLKHVHILSLLDAGIHEHFLYLVVEYAPNGSLRDLLKRRQGKPLPIERAVDLLSQIGQALHYAHRQDIVHRDLKPENILFNADYEPLLADFGIAAVLEATRTQQLDVIGTPAYMAPEQFEGTISTRSDQYALGCIAYELVTGRKPFAVPYETMHYHHAKVSPIPPRQFNPDLPLYIEQAILTAMAKERADRFGNVASFIAALQPASFFEQLFVGATGAKRQAGPQRGADIRYDLTITFEEAVFGCQKELELPRWENCSTCHGSRVRPGASVPCETCRGQGRVHRIRRMVANIPAGVDDGINVRVTGEGEVSSLGGPPGNLYITLTVKPHPFFQRRETDIFYELPLNSHQARFGCKMEIPTLDGQKKTINIPPGTHHEQAICFKGQGVPVVHSSERGDFYVIVKVNPSSEAN